jgi:MFS transporter, PPP family, 3-phenylpropionic acid transporter
MSLPMPWRLGLFYAALFIGNGAAVPYVPVWFADHGLSGAQIGLIISAPLVARALTAPAIALWADSFRLRRTPILLLALATAAAYALLPAQGGFLWWFAMWFLANTAIATITPLAEVVGVRTSRSLKFNYGFPRGIGSAGYVVGNIAVGVLLVRTGSDLVIGWIVASALACALFAQLLLPPMPVREQAGAASFRERFSGLGALLRDRAFVTAVLAIGLIQSAHAFYYSFSALAWKQQGVPENVTGLLWAIGVIAEVCFLWFLEPWRRRAGPGRLLLLGGAAAVIRWMVYAFSPPLWALYLLQTSHMLTFTATYVASLQIVERLSKPETASAAQVVNSAFSGGMLMGVATLGSGWLYDLVGPFGYLAMAAMAAAGLGLAVRLHLSGRLPA